MSDRAIQIEREELDDRERAEADQAAEHQDIRRDELQPCVNCGTRSRNRWCSTACFVAEDGVPDEWLEEVDDE